MRRPAWWLAGIATALLAGACDAGGRDDRTLTVFAAASLSDAFGDVAIAFEAAEPGLDVDLNLAASSTLREQVLAGAPADVFAAADPSTMDDVVAAGEASDPRLFASNRLQIVVPAGNPAGVDGLDDLADEQLLVGLCAEQVPCGRFAREALANAGITAAVDTDEPDVRALLTKVAAGELDAGIVYVTDVLAAGAAVRGIDIPDADNVVATYPIAVVAGARDRSAAEAFVDFVLSEPGRAILADHGFEVP